MKKIIALLLIFSLTSPVPAFAFWGKKDHFTDIKDYAGYTENCSLKLLLYYKPCLEGNMLFDSEYFQYGTAKTGTYRMLYGYIITKKFNSAFNKMFKAVERSHVEDLKVKLLEAKSKDADLVCDVNLINKSFMFDKRRKFSKEILETLSGRKPPYVSQTDVEIEVAFYLTDGSVASKKTYSRTIYEPVYKRTVAAIADRVNYDFAKGVEEILTEAINDLTNSEKFKQITK